MPSFCPAPGGCLSSDTGTMRVCIISHKVYPEYSGMGVMSVRLAEALRKAGTEAVILSFVKDKRLAGSGHVGDIPVERICLGKTSDAYPAVSRLAGEMIYFLRNGGFNVVHWQGFMKDIIVMAPLLRAAGTKVFMTSSLIGYDDYRSIKDYGGAYALALRGLNGVISPCPALA